ncbi:uncharacterized protein IL334_000515 [Kwoniella shivajii]|uniref:Bromodomain-containing factor 1 n=1 Tax=Kwoniella shivajii TaxID=564305 RepID=A0ABZ1CPB8_9TREE|nr:hypothetical protein IL334_000515 [Kwoniella shivajii]
MSRAEQEQSSTIPLPLSEVASRPPVSQVEVEPSPIKPLLNPLQFDGPPPSSTIVEPPKSPNPSNPSTDAVGNAVPVPLNGDTNIDEATLALTPAVLEPAVVSPIATPAPVAAVSTPIQPEQPVQSPLPPDATVPPTPRAEDESPPILPSGTIPSAVPTPSVIITEEQEAKGGILGVDQPSLPTPAPEEPAQISAPTELAGERMEIDARVEAEPTPSVLGLQSSVSDGSLKRAGDDLEEERDEKRLKEASISSSTPNPALASTPIPAQPEGPAPPAPTPSQPVEAPTAPVADVSQIAGAWLSYQPPAPRPSGPTTPLTQHQHKHLLNAVRALKKKTPDVYAFLAPVDPVALGIPLYPEIIDHPMDLGTVETKLIVSDPRGPPKDKSKASKWDTSKGAYKSYSEVVSDVRQIWENTRKFNGSTHVVSLAADRLDSSFENSLSKIPPEPIALPTPTPVAPTPPSVPTPIAGPSSARRASVSQPPTIRRSSDDARPKREIHPPPSKDLAYEENPGSARKPKRRNDPQLQWGNKVVKSLETTQKFFPAASPFLYPVEKIIEAIPDYQKVIKKPIDLLIIKDRLEQGAYDDVNQLDSDMRLMIANALKFNPPGDAVNTAATQLLQIWSEKWQTLPPKQEIRDSSEDPLADNYEEPGYESEDDSKQLKSLESQVSNLNDQIAELRAKIAKGRANRPIKGSKPKAPKAASTQQRKQSTAKYSPGVNGNGHPAPKKSKKTKEVLAYKDEDEDMESEEEEPSTITLTQKQELAEKIQSADGDTLHAAIAIIQQTTNLGANNEEIELDIDSLPVATVIKLYNLVCRGGRGGAKAGRKSGGVAKKAGKKASGGVSKRSVNEREEAERIRRMEAQLQSFDSRTVGAGAGPGQVGASYEEGESSSEEESSDEE